MKIEVIGLGYVGLSTAAVFADSGFDVIGVDRNAGVVETINAGAVHIVEPDLEHIVQKAVREKKLIAKTLPSEADAFVIAVPTPNSDDVYMSCDLTHVLTATEAILPHLRKGNLVVIESTIAPRTVEDRIKPVIERKGFTVGKNVFLAHCPERAFPGQILHELVYNNRVIGGVTPACADKAAELYGAFVKGEIIKTDSKTAEMCKLMENTFRDVNIALSNELAKICCKLGIDVLDVIRLANKHPRVNIHTPGPGVGGHCLAVDPYFIYATVPDTAKMIKLARDVNESMPDFVVESTQRVLCKDRTRPIAVFGAAYKPDVDDTRESPALKIIEKLNTLGYETRVHDPYVLNEAYVSAENALRGAGLLLCLVGHSDFRRLDGGMLRELMARPLVFDVTGTLALEGVEIVNYGNLHRYVKGKKGAQAGLVRTRSRT